MLQLGLINGKERSFQLRDKEIINSQTLKIGIGSSWTKVNLAFRLSLLPLRV